MALTLIAFLSGDRLRRLLPPRVMLVGGGIVFPLVTLVGLLIWEIGVLARMNPPPDAKTLQVEVIGYQYWWEVRYPGHQAAVTANEVVLPAHSRIEFLLRSPDVIHSFWIPNLGGKMDLIPGRENRLTLETAGPVVLRGQCAEYCGDQHALMAFDVEVLELPEFELWLARQQAPAATPRIPDLEEGRDAFLANGCGACHTVRGTPAAGRLGPDLTHVGSRRTIAAGAFPNNVGTLGGWIAAAQHLKPGNRMPSFDQLDGRTLRLMATWLASLE
jgi:cytochrome c oxidase subunit II